MRPWLIVWDTLEIVVWWMSLKSGKVYFHARNMDLHDLGLL